MGKRRATDLIRHTTDCKKKKREREKHDWLDTKQIDEENITYLKGFSGCIVYLLHVVEDRYDQAVSMESVTSRHE